ncbi:MAG: D-proline reductase (dithiol) proprotein PrdA [Sporolactobacillus sp.]
MSITAELAARHQNDPAVLCCLRNKGTILTPSDLEDPSIFPDLIDSGLLSLPENALTIGEVLGATLSQDTDAMTALSPQLVEGAHSLTQSEAAEAPVPVDEKPVLHFSISGLTGSIEFPPSFNTASLPFIQAAEPKSKPQDRIVRTLTQRHYDVRDVSLSAATTFAGTKLTLRRELSEEALAADPLVKKVAIDIIPANARHVYSNTIMDVIPIATKVSGILGEGVTHVMDGVVVILTGIDEDGVQVHEFGSCEGFLDEKIRFGRPGCPDTGDIMIRINVTVEKNTGMERRGPYAAHKAADYIIQEIREELKRAPEKTAREENVFHEYKRPGKPRVVLVKEIMGQGAMHDNVLLPEEPAGVKGGRRNVDLGNVPVVLSPNEVRDGGIHALTCIGPATKEVTRHYFREPLVNLMAADEEIDLAGVVFIGSPQVNDEKSYVSARLGALAEALDVEGAIVTTEGFGNNHIDFAENIEQIGRRGIAVVGASYCAYQGQLVVGNQYMDAMIELNKDEEGFENEILGDSTLCPEDATRALLMLKSKMAGVPIAPADRHWSQDVIDANKTLACKS